MAGVTEESLVRLVSRLVEFPSITTKNEREIADFLVERLESSPVKFDIECYEVKPNRPNVVARAGNPENGTVLLIGHTDVVPADSEHWSGDPFELRCREDRLIGRGVSDMKGALAAKLLAAEEFLQTTLSPCEVVLAFVAGEETSGFGAKALVERGVDADAAILGEPTDLQACISQKGTSRFEITVNGQSAHSGRPERGTNATDALPSVLNAIHNLNQKVSEISHPLLTPGAVTVTEVHAGKAPNIVPDKATVTVDWRSVPGTGESQEYFEVRLTDALDEISLPDPDLSIQYDQWLFARPTEIEPSAAVVQAVLEAAETIGVECNTVGFNASTDARHLVNTANIPTVLLGPGTIEDDAHTVNESISVDDLVVTTQIYRRVLALLSEGDHTGNGQ